MMKCSNCDHVNPEGSLKCKKCGFNLIEVTAKLDTMVEGKTRANTLDFSPGEKFGTRYQVIEEIGQGGMGKVFKARDLELNIVVALKMIKPELSSDPDIIARFKRELLLAREILHENVIRIHDLGEIDQVRYISMNYIEGNSLKEIIQSTGKLTIEKSIDIAKQVCSALKVAHSKDIVHRDLKPQNIMIDKKGNAFVLDFGIARSIQATSETEAGIVLGTPDFMSPEQIRGKKADALSDIYSLGIIMYEMVSGELPFKADNPTALLYLHLNEEPVPPAKLNPHMPKKLEKIILKCMAKKKKERYQSIDNILEDLELDKTGQIRPIKEKKKETQKLEKEAAPGGRKFVKFLDRTFLILVIIYAAVSILGLINDSNYKIELDKIKVEDEIHYKEFFPVRKDWLPAQWPAKDCNSWDTYTRLFPPKSDEVGRDIPDDLYAKNEYIKNILHSPNMQDFEKIAADFEYGSSEDLRNIIDTYGKHLKCDELFAAVKCSKLDSLHMIKTNRTLYTPLISKYADMIMLQARADFLDGYNEEGLNKIYNFLVFSFDLLSSSTCLTEDRMAMECFKKCCRELLPLLLSVNLKSPAAGSAAEEDAGTAEDPEGTTVAKPDTPIFEKQENTKKEETAQEEAEAKSPAPEEEDEVFESPLLDPIKDLITRALEKLEPREIFYKEYLTLVRNYENRHTMSGSKKPAYYIYEKFKFWKHGFSINRYFFNKGVVFYQGLFEGLKYIENTRTKSIFVKDYFDKHKTDETIVNPDIPRSCFEINAARMFGKLVLIILNTGEYGLDSKEFSDLKATPVFTSEVSGKPFVIKENKVGFSIMLDDKSELPLRITGYLEDHKQVLKSFRDFDKRWHN